MKTFSRLTGLALLIALASSCIYPLYFSKTYDPEINIEKKTYRILYMNIFDYTSQANVKERKELP
ncbi:MAG: hypothetical protein WCE64_16770, partial [Bacteroidales bacterium]